MFSENLKALRRAKGLTQEEQFRLQKQRPDQCRSLAHATGEF